MPEMRKITARLPSKLLTDVQAETGEGITETLRIALANLVDEGFYSRVHALHGKVSFSDFDRRKLREDSETAGNSAVTRNK